MRINRLRVRNYRCIKDTGELNPTKLFALIGKNNSGKSTIVRALQVFWGGDKEFEIKDSDFHKNTPDPIEILVSLTDFFQEKDKKYVNKNDEITLRFICKRGEKPSYYIDDKKVADKDAKELLPELLVIPALRNPQNESNAGSKSYLKKLITLILKEQKSANSGKRDESVEEISNKRLDFSTDEEIGTFLKQRRKTQIDALSNKVNSNFQEIIEDKGMEVTIEPEGNISEFIESYSTRIIYDNLAEHIKDGINLLSCGTGLQSMFILSLLQTYADMAKCNDSILLIEEPEVYLHPDFQRKMFSALRSIADDNQVIYTTHSPIMIGEVWADKSVRLVTLKNGTTEISPISIDAVISELGIRYEDVLNPQIIVFVEGSADATFYEAMVKHLRPGIASSLSRFVKFITSDGYRNIDSYAYMKILNSDNVKAEFFIIADSDGEKPDDRCGNLVNDILSKVKMKIEKDELAKRITVLPKYAIESYLLDVDILYKSFQGLDKTKLKSMIEFYHSKYGENVKERWESKNQLEQFQAYFSPKVLFKRFSHPKKEEKFYQLFDNNVDFIKTRDSLIFVCQKCDRGEKSIVSKMLPNADLSLELFKEPRDIIGKILERLKGS